MTAHRPDPAAVPRPRRIHAWLAAGLAALFALRVAAQAIQRQAPLDFLPHAAAFQGSALPYPLLLAAQLAILLLMLRAVWRMATGRATASAHRGRLLGRLGGLYLAAALGRIFVGVVLPAAPAWFAAWIPAAFHIVLAGFVLALAMWHLDGARPEEGPAAASPRHLRKGRRTAPVARKPLHGLAARTLRLRAAELAFLRRRHAELP